MVLLVNTPLSCDGTVAIFWTLVNTPLSCDGIVAIFWVAALTSLQQLWGCHLLQLPLDTQDWKDCPHHSLTAKLQRVFDQALGQIPRYFLWKMHVKVQNYIYTHANVCAFPRGFEIVKNKL